jgi:hypothetical protein
MAYLFIVTPVCVVSDTPSDTQMCRCISFPVH